MRGRRIIAVTSEDNRGGLIGIGDALPAYETFNLPGWAQFQSLIVGSPADAGLLAALAAADDNTYIAWNLDVLGWARDWHVEFLALMQACRESRASNLFVVYPMLAYQPGLAALGALCFDTVSGCDVGQECNQDSRWLVALAPHLAYLFLPLPEKHRPERSWLARLASWCGHHSTLFKPQRSPVCWQRASAQGREDFILDELTIRRIPELYRMF